MRIAGALVGALIVIAVTHSVLSLLIIPRARDGPARHPGIIKYADLGVDRAYQLAIRLRGSYVQRDRLLASEPVVMLAVRLGSWLIGYAVGYGLLLWPFGHSLGAAWRESASSLLTLGFASSPAPGPSIIDFAAASSGLILVTLQIAYLPTLYAAYNRRETQVTLLGPLAGVPAWGPEILARLHAVGGLHQLPELYQSWQRWSADVVETHTNYPALLRFRSPDPYSSWLVAQLAVLDAAALQLAACPTTAPPAARLCLQTGFECLRKLARSWRMPVDDDPRPGDPIDLTWEDFLQGWERLAEGDFPFECSAHEAWPHFRGWRVNYESAAYQLARSIDAVPAPWSGSRRRGEATIAPRPVINRTPDDPECRPAAGWRPTGPGRRAP
jgi:hypothetical protein